MNKKRKGSKGFTLIEVLIVVVIIGVLASLILPRMLSAPEKAIVAEANQMIGTMIRAQQVNTDMGAAFAVISDNTTASAWSKLGMQPPGASVASGAGPKFNYTCTLGTLDCRATRNGAANKWVNLTTAGVWSCGTDYTTLTNGGCTQA